MCTKCAKARAAPTAGMEVVVAVIKSTWPLIAAGLLLEHLPANADVLPDQRADVLYHSYSGGGVTVSGPSVLVLKHVGQNADVSANYYVDTISSASIDVVSTASPYTEQRTQGNVSVDYLHAKSMFNMGYTNSTENDYKANTANLDITQNLFGDMTTVSMGYSRGWDTVGKNGQPSFSADVSRQNYRLGLSQVLTKDLLVDASYELGTDQGFLNNPYRSVRYLDSSSGKGYSYEPEIYPKTRTGNALAATVRYYLPYRAKLQGRYRFYTDTWGITAHTVDFGYTQPLHDKWSLDLSYRYYTQGQATFYSDLFPYPNAQNYLARDRELSSFNSQSFGMGLSYDFTRAGWKAINKSTLNVAYNHLLYDYKDFRDVTKGGAPGQEPLYSFSADVVQVFLSIWF
jgi:hypothetical protein